MKAFVLAETSEAAYALCAGARIFASRVIFVAVGDTKVPHAIADEVAHISIPKDAVYDDAADTIISYFDKETPEIVFSESTRRLKTIIGKLCAHAGTAAVTDVTAFEEDCAQNLYFGGIGQRRLKAKGLRVYTMSPSLFIDKKPSGENSAKELSWLEPKAPMTLISTEPIKKTGVDLTKANSVVAVGRGFAEESDLDLAKGLCEKLDAGLGCTRPLTEGVDWLPRELYIGVTGLVIAPKVYIACGISGQMQHMVGCNRSETIFAINKDANAPIFKQCDYGIVGDVTTVLPALIAEL